MTVRRLDDPMIDPDTTDGAELPAGEFSSWLADLLGALRGERDSDVPCDGCTACCRSSQFVHVGPDETDALAHIPRQLLFPAPGLSAGHVLMGYDEHGRCPMLIEDRCSIYEHRPRACRTYDCRIFPATGLDPERADPDGGGSKVLIAERARRWSFSYADEEARTEHEAVRAAARFVGERRNLFPDGRAPTNPTQLAVLAIDVHDAFLRRDESGLVAVADPDPDDVRSAVARRRRPVIGLLSRGTSRC